MATLKYWLWLTTRAGLRTGEAAALAQRFGGAERVYFADRAEFDLLRLPRGLKESLADKDLGITDKILEQCDRLNIRLLTMQDAEYPERLRQIREPPALLYVKGKPMRVDEAVTVAVVGARRASDYGCRVAADLTGRLSRAGVVLVSGIAQGIDSAGLRGALRAGGRVISVLGGGIDVVWPPSSAGLFADIGVIGTLVSEYPPGTPTEGWHFPIRNRILAGLAQGVVVVEAGKRSGALITARLALEENRDIFAVPGPVDAIRSAGANALIQSGAKMVCDAEDVLEDYRQVYPDRLRRERESAALVRRSGPRRPKPVSPPEKLEETDKRIDKEPESAYSTLQNDTTPVTQEETALLAAMNGESLCPDELVERTGLSASQVLSALTLLQVRGAVLAVRGNRFRAAEQGKA